MSEQTPSCIAVIPAAGVGARMRADRPKQYLTLLGKTVLEHTVSKLLGSGLFSHVLIAVAKDDPYFDSMAISQHPQVIRVTGGRERADSVLSALRYATEHLSADWVAVHDAARPCVQVDDIKKALSQVTQFGAILACPVRDTMKWSLDQQSIEHTLDRSQMWHAMTPQIFPLPTLKHGLEKALENGVIITDEASVFEWLGHKPLLVTGRSDNIKITQPEDLALAEFYLSREKETA